MDIIGLASGGKDSSFNMLECIKLGHKIVVLANLIPPRSERGIRSQELDSHMIQTVGHSAVQAIAKAMDVPLVQRETTGTAYHSSVDVGNDVDGQEAAHGAAALAAGLTKEDEVWDLLQILRCAKVVAPSASAVAVGAILSNYQRTRVEYVCGLLGLRPMAMLWRCEQPRLLQRMIASGMVAVPCKVASMGLSAAMLGRSLREIQPRLACAARDFQANICGEGGEYETLTLACPGLFVPGSAVDLQSPPVYHVSRDRFSPVAHLAVSDAVATGGCSEGDSKAYRLVEGTDVLAGAVPVAAPTNCDAAVHGFVDAAMAAAAAGDESPSPTWAAAGKSGGKGTAPSAVVAGVCDEAASAEAVMARLLWTLHGKGAGWQDVVFVRLWVRDMADFADINAEYCRFFGRHPPSRACVQQATPAPEPNALGPPAGCGVASEEARDMTRLVPPRVTVEAVAVPGAGAAARATGTEFQALPWSGEPLRHVHHVQSQSRWAPLCIGPYCQANSVAGNVLCAGQIGLDPATMALVDGGASAELGRAMLSSARVLAAERSGLQAAVSCVLFVARAALSAEPEAELERLRDECGAWLSGAALPASGGKADELGGQRIHGEGEDEDADGDEDGGVERLAGLARGAQAGSRGSAAAAAAAARARGTGCRASAKCAEGAAREVLDDGTDWEGLDMREFDCGEGLGVLGAARAHVTVVVVPRLPRDALVEVELSGVTHDAMVAAVGRRQAADAMGMSGATLVQRAVVTTARTVAASSLVLFGAAVPGIGGSCTVYAPVALGTEGWAVLARDAIEGFAAEHELTGAGSARVLVRGTGWSAAKALAAALTRPGGWVHPVLCEGVGLAGDWSACVHVVWVTGACLASA